MVSPTEEDLKFFARPLLKSSWFWVSLLILVSYAAAISFALLHAHTPSKELVGFGLSLMICIREWWLGVEPFPHLAYNMPDVRSRDVFSLDQLQNGVVTRTCGLASVGFAALMAAGSAHLI